MTRLGPQLEVFTRRAQAMPEDFSLEPRDGMRSNVSVTAVVHDVMVHRFGRVDADDLQRFADTHRSGNNRSGGCVLLVAWLLADPWFGDPSHPTVEESDAWRALTSLAGVLAEDAGAFAWRSDSLRREELVRSLLATVDLRPAGESEAQAEDRLAAISSSQRRKIIAAAQEAERRTTEIREALARQAAQESADKFTRE
jgi:hypothetical protein